MAQIENRRVEIWEIENQVPHQRRAVPAHAHEPIVSDRRRGAAAAARPAQRNARWVPPNNASPERRQQMIGEKLYLLVARENQRLAGRITGMLLEGLESEELIRIVNMEDEIEHYIRLATSALCNDLIVAGASVEEALELINAAGGE